MTDLSVSVVSYRTPLLLRQCLSALESQRSDLDMEITVVDNASGDGSADMVARQFPRVRLVRNERNVGFGAAHNQSLRRTVYGLSNGAAVGRAASARDCLVLNSDATPRPGSLRTLVEFLDAHPGVAVAGPRLRYPDGAVQPSRRRFPEVATLFFESTQLQRFWPDNRLLRRYYVADRSDDDAQAVDWLVGPCLCVRTSAIEQIGVFDERFFMYSEELDWCRRFRAAGWEVVFVPQAEVTHLEGGSSRLDLAARDRLFQASKLQYATKWHGPRVALALRAYLIVEYVARAIEESAKLALGSRAAERRERLRVICSGLRHALRG